MKEEKPDTTSFAETLSACLQWVCSPRGGNNFYGRVLNGCSRGTSNQVPTAAVALDSLGVYHFECNPDWFMSIEEPLRIMTIVHEAGHLVLLHLERMLQIKKMVGNPQKYAKLRSILNIAADMATNDIAIRPMLLNTKQRFHEFKTTLVWPEDRKYPLNETFEAYFALLLEDLKNHGFNPEPENISVESLIAAAQAGSGQGNQNEEKEQPPTPGPGDMLGDEYPQWFKDILNGKSLQNSMWDEIFDDMTEAEIERALSRAARESKQIIKHAVEQTIKTRGTVPSNLQAYIDKLLEEATIPWQEVFRGMVKSEISAKLEESTINPNPAYFNLDGIEPYPGYQSNFSFNILLGIDTSGSVSDDEYKEFMAEVLGILKQEDGVSVRKILFDAAIQHEEIVTSEGVLPDRYTYRYGYGGTSFEPFLKYSLGKDTAEDWTQEAKKANVPFVMPDLVLLFTDGYAPIGPSPNGPIPQYSPACPLIWVLTPTGQEDPLMESRVIRIKR